jgi:hypothetical protein
MIYEGKNFRVAETVSGREEEIELVMIYVVLVM